MKAHASFGFLLFVTVVIPAVAQEPDVVLFLDARKETLACLVDVNAAPLVRSNASAPLPDCADSNLPRLFFVQGHRAELRVYNRKFLSDYNITIDAVTTLTGAPIRNLAEAENLTLGAPTFAGPPPSKGGLETINQRSTGDILALLLDETQATKPLADLNADYGELKREQARVSDDMTAFSQNFRILYGDSTKSPDCRKISGAPDAQSLVFCLGRELDQETRSASWQGDGPYSDEQGFRNVIVRVQDLVVAVRTFSGLLAGSNIVQAVQQLDAEVTQCEKNSITFQQNIQSAIDAASLLAEMVNTKSDRSKQAPNLLMNLRLAQIRASLNKTLKPPLDDAEIAQLVKEYDTFLTNEGNTVALNRLNELRERAKDIDPNCANRFPGRVSCVQIAVEDPTKAHGFREDTNLAKSKVDVDLPQRLDEINAEQGRLLARVNEIYDSSEIPDALPKQIDISGHPGNLVVYFTIRRIEHFTRFVVTQVQNPGTTALAPTQGVALPPPAASQAPSPSTPPTSAAAPAPDSAGTVVAHGTFYVHDLYRANVVAAFAFSWARDQNIVKEPQPTACGGSASAPDNNCFSPLLNNSPSQLSLILGVDYYFRPRDTFYDLRGMPITGAPKRSTGEWLRQSTGVMGAVSATKGNNWFLGFFLEPVLGIQLGAGANFTSVKRLQRNFQFGTPVDITGDFPTQDVRVTKPFISVGMDLGLFRKIFGKVTGIGTSATTTQGQ